MSGKKRKKIDTSTREGLEEAVIDILSDLMEIIQIAKRERTQGILGYDQFSNTESRFLELLRTSENYKEIHEKYRKAYTQIRKQAEELERLYPSRKPKFCSGAPIPYRHKSNGTTPIGSNYTVKKSGFYPYKRTHKSIGLA